MTGALVFSLADQFLHVGRNPNRKAAYTPLAVAGGEFEQVTQAIRYRIALLLKPRESKASVGHDRSANLIEAGLLYGRLALLEEQRGNTVAARSNMYEAIGLLEDAHHATPTENHIRTTIAAQDSRQAR